MFWSIDMRVCNRQTLVRFLGDQLEEDDRLDFLYHLDACASCWGEVYEAEKANHPHYYKKPPRRSQVLEKELEQLDRAGKTPDEYTEVA